VAGPPAYNNCPSNHVAERLTAGQFLVRGRRRDRSYHVTQCAGTLKFTLLSRTAEVGDNTQKTYSALRRLSQRRTFSSRRRLDAQAQVQCDRDRRYNGRRSDAKNVSKMACFGKPHSVSCGWLGSRVISVLDSGAEGPGFKSQSRRCRVTVCQG